MPILFQELSTYDPYNAYVGRFFGDRFRYNQLHDKLKKLPAGFKDFIFDTIPGNFIKDRVSIPHGLNENQSKELAIMVLELILTDIYLGNITNEIQNRLAVDPMKTKTITGLIVAELFRPILEELKKRHIEKFAKNMPPQRQNDETLNVSDNHAERDDRTVDLRNNS